jgi:glycopeptide antibiotics resistance protein
MYVPLGVFLASARPPNRLSAISPWLLVGLVVSGVMEMGQSVFGRTPDALDIIANSLGYMFGYWAVAGLVRLYGLDPVAFIGFDAREEQDATTRSLAVVRFIYVCIYVMIAMLPFDVSVTYSAIYSQLFPNPLGDTHIILDPFYHLSRWSESGAGLALEFLGLLPIAILSAVMNGIKGRFDVSIAVFPCVLVAMFCEVSQLFVLSRTSDIAMVPVAVAAGLVGWLFVRVCFRWRGIETPQPTVAGKKNWRAAAVALIVYATIIGCLALSPFQFESNPRAVPEKVLHGNLIPFRSVSSMAGVLGQLAIFVPFGALMAHLLVVIVPGTGRGRARYYRSDLRHDGRRSGDIGRGMWSTLAVPTQENRRGCGIIPTSSAGRGRRVCLTIFAPAS